MSKLVLRQDELGRKKVPVAYIDFVDEPKDSKRQVIIELKDLGFTPEELIFDVDADGNVIGVELL